VGDGPRRRAICGDGKVVPLCVAYLWVTVSGVVE
jgi:hypothetical protein